MKKYVSNFELHDEKIYIKDSRITDDVFNEMLRNFLFTDTGSIISVGENGRFRNIKDAVDYAVEKYPQITRSLDNNLICTIVIQGGTYTESIDLGDYSGFYFLGLGHVILQSNAEYPIGPMYGNGCNTFQNMTFKNTNTNNGYGYHYEMGGKSHGSFVNETHFINCTFLSDTNAGVGIGCANAFTNIRFTDCIFDGKYYGVYLHNSTHDNSHDNYVRFEGCRCYKLRIEDAAHRDANRSSKLGILCNNNNFTKMSFYGGNQGATIGEFTYIPLSSENITLSDDNYGNSGIAFNKYTARVQYEGFFVKGNKGGWGSYEYTIQCENANKYKWNLFQVITSDGHNVTNQCRVNIPSGNRTIVIDDPTGFGVGGLSNIVLIGEPKE